MRATTQPCGNGLGRLYTPKYLFTDQPQQLSEYHTDTNTQALGNIPDRITVRKLARISIFMSKINFFKYVRKTSLQIGRHSILTKYIEILRFTAALRMYSWKETYSQK